YLGTVAWHIGEVADGDSPLGDVQRHVGNNDRLHLLKRSGRRGGIEMPIRRLRVLKRRRTGRVGWELQHRQPESLVYRFQSSNAITTIHQHSDLDFTGGNEANVDLLLSEGIEHAGSYTGVGTHAGADDGDFADRIDMRQAGTESLDDGAQNIEC